MIERGKFRTRISGCIHQCKSAWDADTLQHIVQENAVIFAISVLIFKDLLSRLHDHTAAAEFDRLLSQRLADKLGDGFDDFVL